MESMPSKSASPSNDNTSVEKDRVTVTAPLSWFRGIVATGVYGLILGAIVEDGFPLHTLSLGYGITFIVATAAWAWFVARQRVITVFEGSERTVYRRNILYTMQTLSFDEIAEVTPISDSDNGVYYKIALKSDRLGKGLRLTKFFSESGLDLLHFRQTVLPAINAMLETEAAAGERETETRRRLDAPVRYVKSGSSYVLTHWRKAILIALCTLVFLGLAIRNGQGALLVGAAIAVLIGIVGIHTVVLDTVAKTVTVGRAFGMWKAVYSMERFAGIDVTRSYTNFIYTGTTAAMHFVEPDKSVDLAWGIFTKRLTQIVDESHAIIAASLHTEESDTNAG